ncbi:MAG: type II secretion system protein [Planctomycetota bacterium]|nr:type II secretion system protein [Planctomycetota bacterium]
MKSAQARGFTLVELMVVIAIIGVLVALLMPSLSTVGRTVLLVQCSNNLHAIYQAYGIRTANEVVDSHVNPLNVYRWRGWLSPYFEDKSGILACPEADALPEDDAPVEPDPASGSSGGGGSGGSGGGFFPSGGDPTADDVLKVEVWTHGGWTSQTGQHYEPDSLVYTMDCEEGQYARKYPAGSTNPDHNVVPEGYEYWFEDGWNATWNDLGLRFVKLPDGSLKITMVGEHTGTNWYNLIDTSNNNCILMGDMGWKNRTRGREVTLPPGDKEMPPEGGPGLGGATAGPMDGASATASYAGNYGMNYIAHRRSGASLPSHVILCLDYKKSVAFGPNTPSPLVFDDWQAQGWSAAEGMPVFARHDHRINVLFTDGSVELMDPSDIDPRNGSLAAPYWGRMP